MVRLVFVGAGRMGLALGEALDRSGEVDGIHFHGRHAGPPDHPLFSERRATYRYGVSRPPEGTTALILSVPDGAIPQLAEAVAAAGDAPEGCVALHLSGALSTEVLAPLHQRGYRVGSLHPFQTVAHPFYGAERLPGSIFAVAGEREAIQVARRIVLALGGKPVQIPAARRALYHAGAVMASNLLLALLAASTELLARAGLEPDDAAEAVLSLAGGTLDNARSMGIQSSLTGPILRGDLDTVALHLRALEPAEADLYRALARHILRSGMARLPDDVAAGFDLLFGEKESTPGPTHDQG